MKPHKKARSEHIRHRMEQESNRALRNAKKRIINPVDYQQPSSGFNQSGKIDGAAIKKRLKPGWRVVSFALTGLLSLGLFTALNSPQYQVDKVVINGLERISEEEVLKTINIHDLPIFTVNPTEISKSITARFPEIWKIRVNANLPNIVEIQMLERQPTIIWQMGDEQIWVDNERFLIPARGDAGDLLTILADSMPAYTIDLDVSQFEFDKVIQDKPNFKTNTQSLAFFAQPKKIDEHLLSAILQLNAWMPDEKTLLYQAIRGVGWRDIRGWDVFVGQKLSDINEKILMYENIVKDLEKEGINPTLVSVEFLHAPYYRTD